MQYVNQLVESLVKSLEKQATPFWLSQLTRKTYVVSVSFFHILKQNLQAIVKPIVEFYFMPCKAYIAFGMFQLTGL